MTDTSTKNEFTHKKIVVLESDYLLAAGVFRFLDAHDHITVYGIDKKDPAEICQEIEKIQPDVIILNKNSHIFNVPELVDLLHGLAVVRMVVLNLADNQVQICERQKVVIQELSDFLSVL